MCVLCSGTKGYDAFKLPFPCLPVRLALSLQDARKRIEELDECRTICKIKIEVPVHADKRRRAEDAARDCKISRDELQKKLDL
jgi:hypothetical protein